MHNDIDKKIRHSQAWSQFFLAAILLVAVVLCFHYFTEENENRILNQNNEYVKDVALRAANRMEDMIDARRQTLSMMSYMVSETIDKPEIDKEFLTLLQDSSVFDYVEFIDVDGFNHNANGTTSNSMDRENYLLGIKGQTGVNVIFDSRITDETLVDFYTPVSFNGEIIGVLNGMLREETLQEVLSTELFGYTAKSFLLMGDGTVISYSGYDEKPMDNWLVDLQQSGYVADEDIADIEIAFSEHGSYRFYGQGTYTVSCVSVVPVGEDWMLVQTFPSAVTKEMKENANKAGIKLELRLLTLFLIFVLYLIAKNMRRHSKLSTENTKLDNIVQSLMPLFERLAIIDYENQSYQYLQGTPSDFPANGPLTELRDYISSHYVQGEDAAAMISIFDQGKIASAFSQGKPYLQYEYRVKWNLERWEDASILCLEENEGIPISAIFAVQDVTSLKTQEAAIQQALRDAFHAAEDMSHAKSDFLARMSHDMRTPMNAVLGMTQVALTHLDDQSRVENCLKKISLAGHRLLKLINEALNMSKIESGGIVLDEKPFCLTEKVEEAYKMALSIAAEKGQQLQMSMESIENEQVLGDTERLEQVLANLLDNAIKYTPPGGTISLKMRELPSHMPKSGYYEFIVEDNGIGIDPAIRPTIFEPFVRAESSSSEQGIGLGLPIAKTIVKLMDGDIKIESEMGKGTKFTVHLFLKLQDSLPSKTSEALKTIYKTKSDIQDGEMPKNRMPEIGISKAVTQETGIKIDNVPESRMEEGKAPKSEMPESKTTKSNTLVSEEPESRTTESNTLVSEVTESKTTESNTLVSEVTESKTTESNTLVSEVTESKTTESKALTSEASESRMPLSKIPREENSTCEGMADKSNPLMRHAGAKVLLVEDNEINREIAEELLEMAGVSVETSQNGAEAVSMVKERPYAYYDVILMDLQMPVMNGYDAAKAIRNLGREDLQKIPIIAVSANAFQEDISQAKDAGMNDHLMKPIDLDHFLAAFDRWLVKEE